ncbi:MAG: hypothetical protein PQJ61_17415 [Spirochaetales bacterium]|uniref:WD40 repeat domain-containing protein n=1 Tax=Candidatus Thalassospirochaeta sargassi TaxID=3119039 RepID=A0AAJ1MPX1_9SPIO|nr:hypothetical protein [Spirochaetales bacterium]
MRKLFLILFFVILLVYIIFFPHQLQKELVVNPSWVVETTAAEGGTDDHPVPFNFDSRFGYFSASGRVLFSDDVVYRAAVSSELFINYSSVSEQLVLQNPEGDIIGTIDSDGYPFFIGERLFVIAPDRMTVTEYDYEGFPLLHISPGAAVTSMDAGSEHLILGMLNGDVSLYTDSPDPVYTYYSTDSRYSVSYACALTDDGSRFAAVTGLYPQQLVCFEFRNDEYIPVFRMNMSEVYRRNLLLDYSDDGRLLYLETPGGLDVYSTATFLKQEIETAGEIRKAVFPGEKTMSFILSSLEDSSQLRLYRSDLGTIADLYFPSGDIYFYLAEGCFYVGIDGRILRYDIIEG